MACVSVSQGVSSTVPAVLGTRTVIVTKVSETRNFLEKKLSKINLYHGYMYYLIDFRDDMGCVSIRPGCTLTVPVVEMIRAFIFSAL